MCSSLNYDITKTRLNQKTLEHVPDTRNPRTFIIMLILKKIMTLSKDLLSPIYSFLHHFKIDLSLTQNNCQLTEVIITKVIMD